MSTIFIVASCLFAVATLQISGETALSLFAAKHYSAGVVFFIGLSIWALVANALLVAGIFEHRWILLLLTIVWLFFIWSKKSAIVSFRLSTLSAHVRTFFIWKGSSSALFACVCLITAAFIALNFVPLSTVDGAAYHLPFARDFIVSHRINQPIAEFTTAPNIVNLRLGYLPALAEVIFATIVLISGLSSMGPPIIALQSATCIALLIALYAESKPFVKRPSARYIALLLLLITPLFRDSITFVGMIDLILAAFIVLGGLLVISGYKKSERSSLYIGALFLGIALAIKYLAVIAVAYCGVLLFASLVRLLTPRLPTRQAYIAAAILFLAAAFWYVKNLILFHNPFYPLFGDDSLDAALQNARYLPQGLWFKAIYPVGVYMTFVFAKTAARLAVVPFAMALGGIVGVFVLFIKNHKVDFYAVAFLGFPLFYSYATSFVSDDMRFNLPALILFALVDALLLDRLFNAYSLRVEKTVSYAAVVVAIVLIPLMLGSSVYAPKILVLRGKMSVQTYIETQTPEHSVDQYNTLMDIR